MKCLDDINMIAFILNDLHDEQQQKANMEEHLQNCPLCRKRIGKLRSKIAILHQQNEKECRLVQHQLQNYLEQKTTLTFTPDIVSHLSECAVCSFIFRQLEKRMKLRNSGSHDIIRC